MTTKTVFDAGGPAAPVLPIRREDLVLEAADGEALLYALTPPLQTKARTI